MQGCIRVLFRFYKAHVDGKYFVVVSVQFVNIIHFLEHYYWCYGSRIVVTETISSYVQTSCRVLYCSSTLLVNFNTLS